MPQPTRSQLSELLQRMHSGDGRARDALFATAYPELRRIARARLRHGGRNTVLDTTSLVHESYLRLAQADELRAQDRRAFFSYASKVMRSVIVDCVNERLRLKRGGQFVRIALSTDFAAELPGDEQDVVKVHEALVALEQAEPRGAQVVEMRYFGGYTEDEIAQALGVSGRTVRRDWEKACALLLAALR